MYGVRTLKISFEEPKGGTNSACSCGVSQLFHLGMMSAQRAMYAVGASKKAARFSLASVAVSCRRLYVGEVIQAEYFFDQNACEFKKGLYGLSVNGSVSTNNRPVPTCTTLYNLALPLASDWQGL